MIHFHSPSGNLREKSGHQPQRGYSLVEMLVVITASGVVLMIAYTLLVMVMKRTAGGNDQLARAESTSRASARFRQLVHESGTMKVAGDGQALELTVKTDAGDAPARLQLATGPMRLELVEPKTGIRQMMGLTGIAKGRFLLEKPAGFARPLVTLELWPKPGRGAGQPAANQQPILIQAASGLDSAEAKAAGGSGK
jgi:prepilin-type N-terminal cleavage/methylation domain-containing protein